MTRHLRSCIECARHIRITEATCPFCKAPVPDERKTPPPRGTQGGRLGRAVAVTTLAAASSLGAAACGDVATPEVIITAADAYGASEPREGGLGEPDVSFAAAYGVAYPGPDRDAGDGGDVREAGERDGPITYADAYGVAPTLDADDPDVFTGGQAYGVAEPFDAGEVPDSGR